MALKSPLIPSPSGGGLSSSFSSYSDSPNSPARFGLHYSGETNSHSNRSSGPSDSLAPPASPYPQQIEPSPVDSNGTESTEIEDDAQEDTGKKNGEADEVPSPDIEITSPESGKSEHPPRLDTQLPLQSSTDSPDDAPQSVIHVPEGFKDFDGVKKGSSQPERHESIAVSPVTPEPAVLTHLDKVSCMKLNTKIRIDVNKGKQPAHVNTNVPRVMERSTPRAQTRQELDEDYKRKSRRTSSLEGLLPGFLEYFEQHLMARTDIPEAADKDGDEQTSTKEDDGPSTAGLVGDGTMSEAIRQRMQAEANLEELRTTLSQCWNLCNSLAGLSSSHRQRTFKFAGESKVQELAWRNCWRLCQQLYDNRDEDHTSQIVPTLELCRDFCASLFEAREKNVDNAMDAVLRVSFELNNHLYNTHDRSLPDAFNERTLEFYITLCHRLMKLRTSLPPETDTLLQACWSLAEMLFTLRQNSETNQEVGSTNGDSELLENAIQACWTLCDLFRDGWSQASRSTDRGTPRPSQATFGSSASYRSGSVRSMRSGGRSTSSISSNKKFHDAQSFPPETPVTIFDDSSTAESSPDSASVPNILVLGPASSGAGSARGGTHHDRWSSNASVLSDYSDSVTSSQRTSSTATATAEETQLERLRCLLLKAGMKAGYTRNKGSLPDFVKALPDNAFGPHPWHEKVLNYYKKLVINDKSMLAAHKLNSRRLTALEVAKAVRWLGNNEQWAWMRDLFRIVFGFGIDDVAANRNQTFTT